MNSQKSSLPTFATSMVLIACFGGEPACAIQITSYTSEANDRFTSGFPTAPVANTNPAFVGAGLDWAGVGWASNDATKGFAFVSPSHYLVAKHYNGAPNIRIFADGSVRTFAQASVEDTGYGYVPPEQTVGDLSLGTLALPVPAGIGLPRYAVLDLNNSSTSNTPSAYNGLNLLIYGRGPNSSSSPRVGTASINSVTASGVNHHFTTNRNDVQLEGGDSGSPAVHRWTNPAGVQEITLLGNHAAISSTSNIINFTGTHQVMGALNGLMNDDGFALRVVGNPTNTWVGVSSTSIGSLAAWGLGGPGPPASPPSDRYVSFDGSTAGSGRVVTVDSDFNLRGLYFLPTPSAGDGFTFEGGNLLTVGRGGITNYDNSRQLIQSALALGTPQVWNGGVGGITVTAGIATNGNLLEVSTVGDTRIEGGITGSGALALAHGVLELEGPSGYSGATWVHGGKLIINNTTGSATGSGMVRVAPGAVFAGDGRIEGDAVISGILAPGNSIGTITIDGNVTWNAGQPWEFELGAAANDQAAAALGLSGQDMLAITNGGFFPGTGSQWTFDFMDTGEVGWYRLAIWTGATGFQEGDFAAMNLKDGRQAMFHINTSESALYLNVIPEPGVFALLGIFGALAGWRRSR